MNPMLKAIAKALLSWFLAHVQDLPSALPLLAALFTAIKNGDAAAVRLATSNLLALIAQQLAGEGRSYGAAVQSLPSISERLTAAGCAGELHDEIIQTLA